MVDLAHFIESRGSLAATWELHTIGMTKHSLRAAVSGGVINRVRQGWYCNPWLVPDAQRAARVGGQLACVSAARHLGLWLPDGDEHLHVSVDPDACQLRDPTSHRRRLGDPDVRVHWSGEDRSFSRAIVSPPKALEQIVHCKDAEYAYVVAESAIRRRVISHDEWAQIESRAPRRARTIMPSATGLSDSGIESLFVARMRRHHLKLRQQALIPGVGFVDVLIGDRLVVELDGAAYHRDDARDRHRDAVCSALGYRVLRFLANQVTREWPLVESAVLAAVLRGDHLA